MRTTEQIRTEIRQRFGFFPPFFAPAQDHAELLEGLWQQTLSIYLNNPLPAAFRERLFAYLSRYCALPYAIVTHSVALRPLGIPVASVLGILDAPTDEEPVVSRLNVLSQEADGPLETWPKLDQPLENAM